MINNRQAGRRRGRNNPRQSGGGNRGNGDSGNRIDSRARGNAAQLLEKYRNLARDAQMAGDRVNAEYYFQFADHYFRVLADNRARQEEQQQRFRRHDESDQDNGDESDELIDAGGDESDEFAPPQQEQRPRRERAPDRERAPERPRERSQERKPRRVANDDASDGEAEAEIGLPGLPPSIARVEVSEDAEAEAPAEAQEEVRKPRRGRRPRQPEAAE
ncbi:hypothetical protein SLG_36600 [Sphingobium sp. SYK-6]|uniref:DUF4167 domain-containing protein n=1 Tax=Sphingobium sp. (strain NBRC 103272 / SYK-6) TaxID=627192 RepID=UPI0002277D49|nr:DUF4167 domain-containing protein [Sphingobium sp. SYK-6]BAK68335.1 hypothetical protein SLG_36600 [Sphingobium sp. SYK-6]